MPARTSSEGPPVWRARLPITVGFAALAVLVLGLGAWSITTRLSGAVIATGAIQIQSNRQVVQHAEGGVVGEILVRDGDVVAAGDMLIRFDDTLHRSELAIVEGQLFELMTRSARLKAERDGAEEIIFSDALLAISSEQDNARKIDGQRRLFRARIETQAREAEQLQEQISQLEHQVAGTEAQITSLGSQLDLIGQELESQTTLLSKGLTQSSRVTSLQREQAALSGEIGRLTAAKAQIGGQIAATRIEILKLGTQRREAAITELRDTEFRMAELSERRLALLERLSRMDVRAPTSGIIYGSVLFAERAVVQPAEPMMYVIPQDQPLVAMARIEAVSIDQVFVGQPAILRLPAFDQRFTPELNTRVERVSADVFEDQATGTSFYAAELSLTPDELARLGDQALLPGMPIEAYLKTDERTPLSYLTKPLMDYFYKAMRG
ncbi:HlyD family type I secretion periplasmic adaptor subunit [Aliiroseovarius sp. S2029]|uniref:HlyD family type I secretion periplasmic adaptor subunit n=1 Tax=Aliiroseovarius sp. S2029 TaxID=2936988 RepID=UPI0020C129E7|nr:HlyD family type I secretion periplasmic adaptor subunit [Aliiroseovarius sp. S2029]MCK8485483.1 HlyD family type I secretion periplasmic adaptor subunit [Aliiroseovarius sp. S2029]